ncbi:hypothetical protein EST38_g11901 [Candolleomyces aberdarensis]|uniref:Aminotransferase class I/classII domain-containing protein n=1 Tax=Candolleomyces aberdarensis TaxID=2316362 RepID=A0A4Q2D724_9AGAR|nr:hypothetical protein EST38_g11901 [Candolleomyces aberdarensis]
MRYFLLACLCTFAKQGGRAPLSDLQKIKLILVKWASTRITSLTASGSGACSKPPTGGVMTMNATVYEYLSNHSVPWMFTSAPAHVDMIGMKFCFDVLKSAEADRLRETVMDLSHFFLSLFAQSTRDIPKSVLSLLNSETKNLNSRGLISPIFAIFSPDVVALQNHLNEKGYAARALAPPAVPRGKERLRVVIHAGNSEEQIKSLVEALREWALAQGSNVIKQDEALRSKL